MGDWMIDGCINLTALCENERWHLASVIARLQQIGLERRDAQAFACFAFADAAVAGDWPDELVTPEQRARLTRGAEGPET